MGLFNKRSKSPNMQPMLIKRDELESSIIEAYKKIKQLEMQERKDLLKKDELTNSMRDTIFAVMVFAIVISIIAAVSLVMYLSDKWSTMNLTSIVLGCILIFTFIILAISIFITSRAVKKEQNREYLATFSSFTVSLVALIVSCIALFK